MNTSMSRSNRNSRRLQQRRRNRNVKAPFNFKLWMKSRYEMVRTSMFFSPALAIFSAIGWGYFLSWIDVKIIEQGIDPPVLLNTTVDSARSLLSTIAGATISFAGTAFSVSLLVIQLGSTQYSPRVVHTLSKDPFNRRIVAFVVGTFTYCLVVMRSMDGYLGPDDAPVVPNVSVAVAVILGILSVLFIVAFIDHSANTMDISQLLERVTNDTIASIKQTWREDDAEEDDEEEEDALKQESVNEDDRDPDEENDDNPKAPKFKKGEEADAEALDDCHVVRFQQSGWVQELDVDGLLKLVPPNGYIKVHTYPGRYAIPGAAMCIVYPRPEAKKESSKRDVDDIPKSKSSNTKEQQDESDEKLLDEMEDSILDCIFIGESRTMRCDATYGLRQLVDVVLRALSPGVNDPTTAQDGIFHVAAVVNEFLHRVPPEAVMETEEGGKLVLNESRDYDSIVRFGYDEARVCAASSPTVAMYLLESLRLIRESLIAIGRPHRAPEIERQAKLIEGNILNANHLKEDNDLISQARSDRFQSENFWNRGLWSA